MKDIDFLPQWYRQARRSHDSRISRLWLAMIGLCALAVWFGVGKLQTGQAQAQLAYLTDQNQMVQEGLDLIGQLEEEQAELQERYKLAQELAPTLSSVEILSKLADLIPPQIALKKLEVVSKLSEPSAARSDKLTALAAKISAGTPSGPTPPQPRTVEMEVSVIGLAPSETDVAILVGQLAGCRDFRQVRLEYCKAATIEQCQGYSFKASLTVEAAAWALNKDEDS